MRKKINEERFVEQKNVFSTEKSERALASKLSRELKETMMSLFG